MNSRITRIVTLIFTLLLSVMIPSYGMAQNAIPKHTGSFYVNDFANVMDQKTENYLVNYGIRLHKDSGAQVVLVTVNSTDGTPIKEYATELFNSWGVGSAEKNNGLLLLLSIQDDDYWAVQGKGIENSLSNDKISNILSQFLEPDFAAKNYNSGARKTYGAFIQSLGGIWAEQVSSKNYVADNAGVFKQVTKDYINQSSNQYRATTGTGIYVVTVNKNGEKNLQDYTYKKFSSMGAGPKDVIMVLDINGNNYHVLQGKDIDQILTNDKISNILNTELEPLFAKKQYATGATATANAFYSFFLARADSTPIKTVKAQDSTSTELKQESSSSTLTKGITIFSVIIVLLILIGIITGRRNNNIGLYGVPYNPYSSRNIRRYGPWQGQVNNGYRRRWYNRNRHPYHHNTQSIEQNNFWGNRGDGGSTNGGGAGRYSVVGSYQDEDYAGEASRGGGAGRYSSEGSSYSDEGDDGGSSGGDNGSASSGGGAGRHS
ncbi:MAG: TPM domain-containing protein [Paenibacillus sp.]|nr:TPM domain-containing protein [Paenibacillus sp.]